MLANYFRSKFRSLKEIVSFIKDASAAAIIRLFNTRRSRYDDLIKRMDSFSQVVHAASEGGPTEIDVTGAKPRPDGKIDGKSVKTVRFRDGIALPIVGFKAPNRQQLAKDVQMFDEAEQYMEELKEMITRLEKKPDAASKKFVKEMKAYRKEIAKKRDALYDTIEELTDQHAPEELLKLSDQLMQHVNDTIPADAYSEMGWDMHISSQNSLTSKKREPVEFTYYLYIDELNKDQFKSDQLIIVLTGVVHEVKSTKTRGKPSFYMTFHMTALPKFMSPGSFKIGSQLSGQTLNALSASAKREATKLISMHSMLPSIGRRKINVTQQQIRHSGILDVEGIVDVSVEDDEIVIDLAQVSEDVIQNQMWPEIIVYLRKLLRAPKKSSFVYNIEKVGRHKVMRVANVKNVTDN